MKLGGHLVWAAVAVVTGTTVLLGYFVEYQPLLDLRVRLLQLGLLLAATALVLGLLNLLRVHWNKLSRQAKGWPYSAVLMVFFLGTLVWGLMYGPDEQLMLLTFNYIQLPVEASLVAVLSVALVVAGFRAARRRRDFTSLVFVATALIMLLVSAPWPGVESDALADARAWLQAEITQVFAVGGGRGILLGVALGAIATGLRVLLASDRPYGS